MDGQVHTNGCENFWSLLKRGLKGTYVAVEPFHLFRYPIAVFTEWRGKAFYIGARYRAHTRQPEDDFIVRRARMRLKGFGRFDLAYFRHTERWFTVYYGLTAAECFEEIAGNEVFWPM